MKTKRNNVISSKMIALAAAVLVTAFLVPASLAASKKESGREASRRARNTSTRAKEFDTPKQAADALIQVAANFDVAAGKEIRARTARILSVPKIRSMDKNRATAFANKAKEKTSRRDKQAKSESSHSDSR